MQVYIVFGLGLGDNEDSWEVCDVKLSETAAQQRVAGLSEDNEGVQYKYEAWDAS